MNFCHKDFLASQTFLNLIKKHFTSISWGHTFIWFQYIDADAAKHSGCVTKVNEMLARRDNWKATRKQGNLHTSTHKIQMYLKNNMECTTSYAKGRGASIVSSSWVVIIVVLWWGGGLVLCFVIVSCWLSHGRLLSSCIASLSVVVIVM